MSLFCPFTLHFIKIELSSLQKFWENKRKGEDMAAGDAKKGDSLLLLLKIVSAM